MTANAPTADTSEEEVMRGNKNNQQNKVMKDNITHSNIYDRLIELNSGAGTKDDDTGTMEEDYIPRENKLRDIKKSEKYRKNKEK